MSEPRRFVISEQDDEETTIDRRARDRRLDGPAACRY